MNRIHHNWLVAGGLAAIFSTALSMARAESIAITNGSFEEPALAAPTSSSSNYTRFDKNDTVAGTISGWSAFHGYAAYVAYPAASDTATVGGKAAEGSQYFGSFSAGSARTDLPDTSPVLIGQTLSATYQANTTYTLSAYVGRYTCDTSGSYEGYGIGLADDSEFLAVKTDNTSYDVGYGWSSVAVAGDSPTAGNWLKVSLTYTTPTAGGPIGQNIRIRLGGSNYMDGGHVGFDNVTLDAAAVPEPSLLTLFASGLLGLLAYAWRKRK